MDGRNKYREVRAGGEKRVERRRSGAKCPKGKPEFKYLPRRLAGRRPPPSRPVEPASPVRGRHVSERLAPPGLTSTQQALGGHAEAGRPRDRHADCGERAGGRFVGRAGRDEGPACQPGAQHLCWLGSGSGSELDAVHGPTRASRDVPRPCAGRVAAATPEASGTPCSRFGRSARARRNPIRLGDTACWACGTAGSISVGLGPHPTWC